MEVSGQLHAPVALSQGEESTVPTEHEAGWVPEPVWTRWRKENNQFPCRESNTGRLAGSRVNILTELTEKMHGIR
jgi:hypothetical protein